MQNDKALKRERMRQRKKGKARMKLKMLDQELNMKNVLFI